MPGQFSTVTHVPQGAHDLHAELEKILKGPEREPFHKALKAGNVEALGKILAAVGVAGAEKAEFSILANAGSGPHGGPGHVGQGHGGTTHGGGGAPLLYVKCDAKRVFKTIDPVTGKTTVYIECK